MKKIFWTTLMLAIATSAAYAEEESSKTPVLTGLSGLEKVEPIKANLSMFSSNKPVSVPKSWKFVAVSNGEKVNSNNLWFQDTDGNIYVIGGYNDGNKFVLSGNIQKLEVK